MISFEKNSLLISLFLFSVLAHCRRETAFSFSFFSVEIFISEASLLPPSLTANAQLLNGLSVDLSFSLTHARTPLLAHPHTRTILSYFNADIIYFFPSLLKVFLQNCVKFNNSCMQRTPINDVTHYLAFCDSCFKLLVLCLTVIYERS